MANHPRNPLSKLSIKIFSHPTSTTIETEIPFWLATLQLQVEVSDLNLQFHYTSSGELRHISATFLYTPRPQE